MSDYTIYIGGEFQTSSLPLNVINPFTNEAFAKTYYATDEQYESAINAALDAKSKLPELSSFERFTALRYISDQITANRNHLAEILCKESAKPIRFSLGEIDRAAQTFLIAAEESKRLPKEYISLDWTPAGNKKEGFVKYFPYGIVAGITPFNFPLNLVAHKVAPAIAAGCPIILKPSSTTPLSSLELAKIISQTNLPKGTFSVLPMDRKTGNKLVTDERIDVLSFTGSAEVGWEMKKNAGKKRVLLELGGNAAVIIAESANLENLSGKSIVGGFSYSGQICIHAQRFFIHQSLFAQFVAVFKENIAKMKFGDPLDTATDISVMIDQANADRVESWVNEAVRGRAKVLCGGKKEGKYYQPTLLTNVKREMKVCAEEVFGPVVILDSYQDFEDAVDKVNDSRFGLQASVFTDSNAEIEYAFNHLNVGGVIINEMPTFRADQMPYGGSKDSGFGREGVRYSIMEMMEPRILVK